MAVALFALVFLALPVNAFAADPVIYGRGSAHGVGMSMAGVYGMAQSGYNYQQIANYYYPNTVWNTRDDNTVIEAKCQKHGIWVTISVREYLYRLAEEPDTWPKEGIKALMIAARSYLWYKLETKGKFESGQYWIHDINPATRPNIVASVNETTNQIFTYNNRAIVAAYSGSAGGYTARMSEVWGGSDTPYPYLTNKESPWDSVFSSTFKWTKTLTAAAIQKAYPTIGQFVSLAIEERTSTDPVRSRVKYIRITGTAGSVRDKGWNFKSKLGLKSNYFYLEPWPEGSAPPPSTPSPPQIILQTGARKTIARRGKPVAFFFRVRDSQRKNVRVFLIIKKGKRRVGKINAGIKMTNRLARNVIRFRRTRAGRYRYYVVAIDSQKNRTTNPGSNLLIIK